MRPLPGSENVRPASGVPIRIVTAANMFTIPIAAPGASGSRRAAAAKHGANGSPAAKPTTAAASDRERQRLRDREHRDAGAADEEAQAQKPRWPASRPPSGRETTPANSVRPPAIPATCSESPPARWSSVTTQLPMITENPNDAECIAASGSSRRSATLGSTRAGAGRLRLARRLGDEQHARQRDDHRRRERRLPRSPQRHEREREADRPHAARAVEALRERRADRLPDVVAARDERGRGADPDDRPHADREPGLAPRERGRRAGRDDQQPAAADEPRADPVAEPARRHLQQRVRDEERRS